MAFTDSGMDITEAFKAHFYYETYKQADKAIKKLNGKRLEGSEEVKLNHKGHQKFRKEFRNSIRESLRDQDRASPGPPTPTTTRKLIPKVTKKDVPKTTPIGGAQGGKRQKKKEQTCF